MFPTGTKINKKKRPRNNNSNDNNNNGIIMIVKWWIVKSIEMCAKVFTRRLGRHRLHSTEPNSVHNPKKKNTSESGRTRDGLVMVRGNACTYRAYSTLLSPQLAIKKRWTLEDLVNTINIHEIIFKIVPRSIWMAWMGRARFRRNHFYIASHKTEFYRSNTHGI